MEGFARLALVVVFLGLACAEPPVPVNHVCPPFDPSTCLYSKPSPAQCNSDSQCEGSMKCCCSNCGWQCVQPLKVKAGRCPQMGAKCNLYMPEPECSNDFDCPNLKKCCKICGYRCKEPVPEPRGVCPQQNTEKSSQLQCSSAQCSRDTDCKANEKCCLSGGEKKCVVPE